MNSRFLMTGVLGCLLISGAARADVLINSLNVAHPLDGHDGYSDSAQWLGQSFYAPTTPGTGASASMLLSAANPGDGGSIAVYLVADDGSGTRAGVPGNPTYTPTPGGSTFTGLTNSVLVGSIFDATLGTTPTVATIKLTSAAFSTVSAATKTNEYWLVANIGSNHDEWYNNDGNPAGVGAATQAYWNSFNNTFGPSVAVTPGDGPYDLIVDTPEPTTLALLGGSLAGLGLLRRRRVSVTIDRRVRRPGRWSQSS